MAAKPRNRKATTTDAKETTKPKTGNVYKAEYRPNMKTFTNKAGRIKIDNDDQVARTLREANLDDVYKTAAKELGEAETALRKRYAHLNVGMQRMNLGNRIRGARSRKAKEAQAKRA